MFLKSRRFKIRLVPWRIAQRETHNWPFKHRMFATARNNPGNDDETQKGGTDEKRLPLFLNQMIQELEHTGDMNNRVFHTILRGLSASLQQLAA
jgi:hypothetical protein